MFFDEDITSTLDGERRGGSSDPDCVTLSDAAGPLMLCQRVVDPPNDRTAERAAEDAQAGPGDTRPFPAECALQVGLENTYRGTRTGACMSRYTDFEVWREEDGVMVMTGAVQSILYSWVYVGRSELVWGHQFGITPWAAWGEGIGWNVVAEPVPNCGQACVVESSAPIDQPVVVGVSATSTAYYQSDVPLPGYTLLANGDWRWWFSKASLTASTAGTVSPTMRCDDDFANRGPGCIMPDFPGSAEFSSGALPEFSAHITQALASGLPGGTQDTALVRLPSGSPLIDLNRAMACPTGADWLPRPAGKSCDEYPFASTVQGAMTGGGSPRTFPGCQINLQGPPSADASGYSICMIDETENLVAGGQLGSILASQRVGGWEPYTVGVY